MSTIENWVCWIESIDWTPEAITAAATVALAVLTLVLATGTFFLWLATRRLVRGAEKTSVQQLRAFVFGKRFSIGPNIFPDGIREYIVFVPWENVGLSPALEVTAWINFQTHPMNEDRNVVFDDHLKIRGGSIVLGPKGDGQS